MTDSIPELAPPHAHLPSTELSLLESQSPVPSAFELVAEELDGTEARLHELLRSPIAAIPKIGGHLTFAGGKRFRPLLCLLAAKACGYEDENRITAAAVAELLHTATLLHDDVVDGGEFRRGRPAARMVFGNGLAVLTGDYCLARALDAMARVGQLRAVQTMAEMVTRMAEGEVAQLALAGDWSIDRKRYYRVIDRKTAALIAWSASVGGLVPAPLGDSLAQFGRELGFAFQIADDVIDYASDMSKSGKARAQDLREGKATLPLLIACERDSSLRADLRSRLGDRGPAEDSDVQELLARVESTGALEAASRVASAHAASAVQLLQVVPDSPARTALEELARFVARREA